MRFISIIVSILLLGTAIFGIYHIVVLFSNIDDPSATGPDGATTKSPPFALLECNENATSNEPCFGLAMTTRHEWLAQPSHNRIDKLVMPVKRIILTDTETAECSTKPQCNYIVRNMQDNQILFSDDIMYNFLISTAGDIYEGRGWALQSDGLISNLGIDSYRLALIGNFTSIPPIDKQVQAVYRFANRAISAGKLNSTFEIYCSLNIFIKESDIGTSFDGNYRKCLNIY